MLCGGSGLLLLEIHQGARRSGDLWQTMPRWWRLRNVEVVGEDLRQSRQEARKSSQLFCKYYFLSPTRKSFKQTFLTLPLFADKIVQPRLWLCGQKVRLHSFYTCSPTSSGSVKHTSMSFFHLVVEQCDWFLLSHPFGQSLCTPVSGAASESCRVLHRF